MLYSNSELTKAEVYVVCFYTSIGWEIICTSETSNKMRSSSYMSDLDDFESKFQMFIIFLWPLPKITPISTQ
jgi:hypothetical protein